MKFLLKQLQKQHIWDRKNTIFLKNISSLAGIGLLSAIFFFFQTSYIPTLLTTWLGIVLLPFVTRPSHKTSGKWGYLGLILLFFSINVGGQSATCYYLLFVGTVLFWLEMTRYRLNYLPFLMLLVLAPIFRNVVFVWSFPIRIEMSKLVGKVLNMMGKEVFVSGNIILMDGIEFSVDPACTGLKMMSIAMILGLFIFVHYERKFNKTLGLIPAVLGLLAVLCLTIFANFSRLLILVLFHIMPERFLHSGMGVVSLVIYVLIPIYFLSPYFVKKMGQMEVEKNSFSSLTTKKSLLLLALLILPLLFIGIKRQSFSFPEDCVLEQVQLPNFKKTTTKDNIVKLVNDDILIYLKPPVGAFGGAHDPRYCWQGSGYEFKHIHPVTIGQHTVYWATLSKEQDEIVTAWWYENDEQRTISEWSWRWQSLSGSSPFRLVNISARDETILKKEIERFFEMNNLRK